MHSRSGSRWITRQGIAAEPVQLPDAGSALSSCIILLAVRAEVSSLQNVAVYERGDATKVMCIQADNAKGCGGIVSVQELGSRRGNYNGKSRRGNYKGKANAHGCSKAAYRCSRSTYHRGVEARCGSSR
jgi:hypothetical protein